MKPIVRFRLITYYYTSAWPATWFVFPERRLANQFDDAPKPVMIAAPKPNSSRMKATIPPTNGIRWMKAIISVPTTTASTVDGIG